MGEGFFEGGVGGGIAHWGEADEAHEVWRKVRAYGVMSIAPPRWSMLKLRSFFSYFLSPADSSPA